MNHRTKHRGSIALILILALAFAASGAATASSSSATAFTPAPSAAPQGSQTVTAKPEIVFKPIPKAGKKYDIDADTVLVYEFNEKPKMGTAFLKIQIFNKKGDKITPFVLQGRSDMPSMRGVHDSGSVEFKLNKKNDYLMPVNVVMPGDWEVQVTILKDGKPVFYGSITFDV
jgi:hypothetical protein